MDFNHISKNLTEEQVSKLKKLYYTYHRQFWCYKKMFKNFKQADLFLQLSSVILTTTRTIVGTITFKPNNFSFINRYWCFSSNNYNSEKFFQKKN